MSWKRESRQGQAGGRGLGTRRRDLCPPRIIPQPVKTATPKHGRICGTVWRKTVRASVHQLHKPPSWAVDVDDLEAAEAQGVEWLEICDLETGVTWSASLSAFRRFGFELDRGHGAQVALPLRYWRHSKGEAETAQQLTLWAEVAL